MALVADYTWTYALIYSNTRIYINQDGDRAARACAGNGLPCMPIGNGDAVAVAITGRYSGKEVGTGTGTGGYNGRLFVAAYKGVISDFIAGVGG